MEKKRSNFDYKYRRNSIIIFSIIIFILLYTFKNTSFLIRSLSTISLILLFYGIDHVFDVRFQKKHYFFILIIAITSFLLSPLYFIYSQYDKIQHFIQPMMFASIVFYMINKLKLQLRWKLTFTFFIVLGSIGLFEIGEYLLDVFFDLKLQGVFIRDVQGLQKFNILVDRIDDTMIDMLIGFLGTGVYVISQYLFLRKKLR